MRGGRRWAAARRLAASTWMCLVVAVWAVAGRFRTCTSACTRAKRGLDEFAGAEFPDIGQAPDDEWGEQFRAEGVDRAQRSDDGPPGSPSLRSEDGLPTSRGIDKLGDDAARVGQVAPGLCH